ncbi:MAG: helix-turn-helix domain-containing protein [Rhizobiaceae bacterium]
MRVHGRVMSIGELGRTAGVSAPTIRYYEEIGLLPEALRGESGQRIYEDTDVQRLVFVRRCRDFGFPIDQVRLLVGLSISADRDCAEVRDIAVAHLAEVRERLGELQALERNLSGFVDECEIACCGGPGRECVVFRDMKRPSASAGESPS